MKGLLSANLKVHGRRYAATSIAILLATTFIMLCFGVAGGFGYSLKQSVAADVKGAQGTVTNLVVNSDTDKTPSKILETLEADPKLDGVEPLYEQVWAPVQATNGSEDSFVGFEQIHPKPFRQVELKDGTIPTKAGQVALAETDANSLKVGVGDTIQISVPGADEENPQPEQLKVVGIVKTPVGMSVPFSYVAHGQMVKLFPNAQPMTILYHSKDMNDEDAKAHVESLLTKFDVKDQVKTNSEYVKDKLNDLSEGLAGMLLVVLIFPGIAAVTAVIVISTTFQVMLAQRQRELALLRSIGADAGQVRRLMLKENLIVGVVSTAIGIALGVVFSTLLNKAIELTPTYLDGFKAVPWWGYVATLAAGVIITLAAGIRPALRASRLSPMVALQPVESQQMAQKRRIARLVTGLVVTGIGAAILASQIMSDDFGVKPEQFGITFLGGAVSFFGVLILMTWLLPYITRAVGHLLGRRSITMQVAGENTWRNPARTGATGTALILGLTLVVMMMVGAGSMQKTVVTEIDTKRPIDVTVQLEQPGKITPAQVQKVKEIQNVAEVIEVPSFVFGSGDTYYNINKGRELSAVSHSPIVAPKPGTIAVNGWMWDKDQKEMSFDVGDKQFKFKTELARSADYTLAPEDYDALRDALGDKATDGNILYIRLAKDPSMAQVDQVISDIHAAVSHSTVGGSAKERAMMMTTIKSMLIATVVMLAVSIVVALVGVANTLSLSVVERRRENGLLRALGMTRRNIRTMITWETLLIAGISVLIGILLGIGYGILGIEALPFSLGINRVIAIPWGQVALAAVIAIGSALLASILPARAAAKATPVQALAAIE